jgi:hypothetical protein
VSRVVILAGLASSSALVAAAAAVAAVRATGTIDEVVVERFSEVRNVRPNVVMPAYATNDASVPAYLRLPRHRKKRRRG